jgi:ribosomal-protein-serine acetyltransferase
LTAADLAAAAEAALAADENWPMPAIVHQGLVLRPLESADAEHFAEAARESAATVGRWMSWCHEAFTVEDGRAWIAMCNAGRVDGASHECGIFDEATGAFLGGAGLNHFNTDHNFCNLGYWVRQSAQRRGVATRAAMALARFGFEQLGLARIEIVTAEGNDASSAVALKVGATFECLARHRLVVHEKPVTARVYSLIPSDLIGPTRHSGGP